MLYHEHPEFYDKPIRLSQDKPVLQVITDFFEDFRLSDVRQLLWQLVTVATTTDNAHFQEPEDRANLLNHYSQLEELIEAAYIINEDNKKAPQKA